MANSAYREFNFGLGEVIDTVRDQVRRFAEERIAPRASEIDRSNIFPRDLWREAGDLGLLGLTVSPEHGGAGLGYLAHTVAMEEISRASAAVGLSYGEMEETGFSDLTTEGVVLVQAERSMRGLGRTGPPKVSGVRGLAWDMAAALKVSRASAK